MNSMHQQLHEKALHTAREYLRCEAQLIGILQDIDRAKTYQHFQMPSLFAYATKLLSLSEHVAFTLIGIARKSVQVPELKAAIEEKKVTVTNARRIAPILNSENKAEWLAKAATLSQAKLEEELAKSFPQQAAPSKVKYKTENSVRFETDLPTQTLEKLKRAQEILSQKKKAHVDWAGALEQVLTEFIERHDPLEKAERAEKRKSNMNPTTAKNPQTGKRSKEAVLPKLLVVRRAALRASLKHQVTLRDENRCAYVYSDGNRCQAKHWLDIHHILEVSHGGTDALENLITLCSAHHRMVHRQIA